MREWFDDNILGSGRLPLFCFFVLFLLTFAFIRFSVRMIRAEVSWWPGNITPGGLHIHHVVFGTVTMVAGGVAGLAVPTTWWSGRPSVPRSSASGPHWCWTSSR